MPNGRSQLLGGTCEGSRSPESAEVDGRVAGGPALEEALDRRVQADLVELVRGEQAMAPHCGIPGGHRLERSATQVAREDDVDDVLGGEAADGRDRVDDRDRALDGRLVVDPELLGELAVKRVDEALARVDAASGKEPVVAFPLLVPAEQDASPPAQERRDTDPGLAHDPEEPCPRSPRSLGGSSLTSRRASSGSATT